MRKRILLGLGSVLLLIVGYSTGSQHAAAPYAPTKGNVPRAYGRLVAAIPDSIGTGLVFEDSGGVIRFVSITGMKEGELARYDQTPVRGGIPKSYGRLVTAVVNSEGTGLVFEDSEGVIRFVTIAGKTEGELIRN
jgi:hypothetical protein